MRIQRGDYTMGDVGIAISANADVTLSGNVDFIFIKPSGKTIRRDASSLSGATATYTWQAGDLDESGKWYAYLRQADTGYFYVKESGHAFDVRPNPQDMAI